MKAMRFLAILGMLIFGMVVGGFVFYFLAAFQKSELRVVTVPNVVGTNYKDAKRILNSAGLRISGRCKGTVVGTYPRPGMRVYESRNVEVYCSGYSLKALLEKLSGAPFEIVKRALDSLGMEYDVTYSHAVEDGEVGAFYLKEKRVFLLVGKRGRRFFRVPDVTGKKKSEAVDELEKRGISYSLVGSGDMVEDQFPSPGSVYWDKVVVILR